MGSPCAGTWQPNPGDVVGTHGFTPPCCSASGCLQLFDISLPPPEGRDVCLSLSRPCLEPAAPKGSRIRRRSFPAPLPLCANRVYLYCLTSASKLHPASCVVRERQLNTDPTSIAASVTGEKQLQSAWQLGETGGKHEPFCLCLCSTLCSVWLPGWVKPARGRVWQEAGRDYAWIQ